MGHLSRWLLTDELRQRIRLKQAALANLIMMGCALLLHTGVPTLSPEARWLWPWTYAALGGMALIFIVIRSGIAKTWRDPALGVVQMVFAMACAASAYVLAGPVRGAVLPNVAVVLMFGMFGLTVRQMVWVAIYTAALFVSASAWWLHRASSSPLMRTQEWVNMGMLALVLASVCILAARLAAIRARSKAHQAALEDALEQNRLLATQDPLTGCLNRRAMTDRLNQAVSMATRFGTPCSVVLIDLDHFKHVNDAHGHAAGDEVLRTVASVARAELRDIDTLGRWGGEEFLVLLPSTAPADAVICAERLQSRLVQVRFPDIDPNLQQSFSAGVAGIGPADRLAAVLERADRAMYQAKQAGRARVVLAGPDPVGAPSRTAQAPLG